ncbi:MAG: DUF6580 family putative transport protein [Candidatus Nezhaarchaeales archaeon]|nr:MAG: hypothetical protein DSO06_01475 [Candidatus Nezhaarchaeota archaeon WYZ-LMO8]TDA36699.1 MAG: hypothetical protein DSO05_02755 [Candidatus Nezhaarchaeota archaeon WYZ-LMO7]
MYRTDYPTISRINRALVKLLFRDEGRVRKFMAVILVILGITGRILLFDLPNIETVAVVSMLAGCILGGIYAFLIPLSVMLTTDICYIYLRGQGLNLPGWQNIFIFTWSGFIMVALIGRLLKNEKHKVSLKFFGLFTGFGLLGTLLYDIWTAFGCWWLFHPHTLSSLSLVYVLQIPFTIYHLLSTLIFSASIGFPLIYLYEKLVAMTPVKVKMAIPSIARIPKKVRSRRYGGGVYG